MSLFPLWDCGHAHQPHLIFAWVLGTGFRFPCLCSHVLHLEPPPRPFELYKHCSQWATGNLFFFFFKNLPGAAMAVLHFTRDEAPRGKSLQASPNLPSDVIIKWFLPLKSVDVFFNFSLFKKVHSFLSYKMVDFVSTKAALVLQLWWQELWDSNKTLVPLFAFLGLWILWSPRNWNFLRNFMPREGKGWSLVSSKEEPTSQEEISQFWQLVI